MCDLASLKIFNLPDSPNRSNSCDFSENNLERKLLWHVHFKLHSFVLGNVCIIAKPIASAVLKRLKKETEST